MAKEGENNFRSRDRSFVSIFKFEVLFLLVVGIKRLEFAISDQVDQLLALSLLFIV
jgi:hypothetical protein